MSWIFLEASDVWLFRDGKPFSAGEGHVARSVFPPHPTTIQGVLRSLLIGHSTVSWSDFGRQADPAAQKLGQMIGYPAASGRAASLGTFSMAGPFLGRREGARVVRQIPLPADVIKRQHSASHIALRPLRTHAGTVGWPLTHVTPSLSIKGVFDRLRGKHTNRTSTHAELSLLWPEDADPIEAPEGDWWIDETILGDYFAGQAFSPQVASDLFVREGRFGIAMDYALGRPRDQMLYQAEFVRPHIDVGLLINLADSITLPADPDGRGLLAIGGETRCAQYELLPPDAVTPTPAPPLGPRLKLVLLTPAWFSGGWQPADGNMGWTRLIGAPVKLISAALKPPQHIGGWDVSLGRPKPMYACVPAGSVYFFEALAPDTQQIAAPAAALTETPPQELPFAHQGFGQVAAGSWEWLETA